jgi:hypothetical protein
MIPSPRPPARVLAKMRGPNKYEEELKKGRERIKRKLEKDIIDVSMKGDRGSAWYHQKQTAMP